MQNKIPTLRQMNSRTDAGKHRYTAGTCEYDVFEAFYACAIGVVQVAYYAIARAYPKNERHKTGVRHKYERAFELAKSYMTRFKTIVRDDIVPLARYKRHAAPYDFHLTDFSLGEDRTKNWEDKPTFELRSMILTQLYFLREKLVDFGPLMLPKEDVESFEKTLRATYETESRNLLTALSYYECDPILTESDFR